MYFECVFFRDFFFVFFGVDYLGGNWGFILINCKVSVFCFLIMIWSIKFWRVFWRGFVFMYIMRVFIVVKEFDFCFLILRFECYRDFDGFFCMGFIKIIVLIVFFFCYFEYCKYVVIVRVDNIVVVICCYCFCCRNVIFCVEFNIN